MVPSDRQAACSPTGMHGQNVASGIGETWALCSPPLVLPNCGSVRRCVSACHPDRSPLLDATFRSTVSRTGLATDSRNCVNVPGLHLRNDPQIRSGPFGAALPPPLSLLWPCEARSTRETRCRTRSQDSWFVFEYQLPSRISRSLGIKTSTRRANHEAYPCRSPDLPSLPAARQQFYSSLSATDHRSRSATSCQARCPSNLLEPQPSCS